MKTAFQQWEPCQMSGPQFNSLLHTAVDIVFDQADIISDASHYGGKLLGQVVNDLTKMDAAILGLENAIAHHNLLGEVGFAGLVLDDAGSLQVIEHSDHVSSNSDLAKDTNDFFADVATLVTGVVSHPWEIWV